jgi:hypothetical protein
VRVALLRFCRLAGVWDCVAPASSGLVVFSASDLKVPADTHMPPKSGRGRGRGRGAAAPVRRGGRRGRASAESPLQLVDQPEDELEAPPAVADAGAEVDNILSRLPAPRPVAPPSRPAQAALDAASAASAAALQALLAPLPGDDQQSQAARFQSVIQLLQGHLSPYSPAQLRARFPSLPQESWRAGMSAEQAWSQLTNIAHDPQGRAHYYHELRVLLSLYLYVKGESYEHLEELIARRARIITSIINGQIGPEALGPATQPLILSPACAATPELLRPVLADCKVEQSLATVAPARSKRRPHPSANKAGQPQRAGPKIAKTEKQPK